jgi:hypothetical protein
MFHVSLNVALLKPLEDERLLLARDGSPHSLERGPIEVLCLRPSLPALPSSPHFSCGSVEVAPPLSATYATAPVSAFG